MVAQSASKHAEKGRKQREKPRVGRAEAYTNYLKQKFAAQHKLMVIPMCAHSSRCIYTSDLALPVLFPKP